MNSRINQIKFQTNKKYKLSYNKNTSDILLYSFAVLSRMETFGFSKKAENNEDRKQDKRVCYMIRIIMKIYGDNRK